MTTKWTLQTKLTTIVVGIVSCLLIIVSVLTAATLRTVLEDQLTTNVLESSKRAQGWVGGAIRAGETTAADVLEYEGDKGKGKFLDHGSILILQLPSGEVSGAYLNNENDVVELTDEQIAPFLGRRFDIGQSYNIEVSGVGDYRVSAETVFGSSVVMGLPRAEVDKMIGLMLAILTALTIGGLVLLTLAIGVTIRTSLRPLRAVAATAQRVSALPLDQGSASITARVDAEHVDEHTEIGRVGLALNTMLDHVDSSLQARAANEEKMRQFVADASHELRTPLASIRGYSELSLRDNTNSENTASSLARIQAQSVRMTRLVEDLLLLARLDEGQELVLSAVDLVPLTIESLADAQAAGRNHTWEWESDVDALPVLGDAGRLHQVVTNLLANARTHTADGTHITLKAGREGDAAVIAIHDNGAGIDPSVREHLFERFARADKSRARNTGGTGLGLSIAHAIALAHNGTLAVDSEPGSTTFTLRLPLSKPTP